MHIDAVQDRGEGLGSAADLRARNRTNHDFGVIGRLGHGASPQRAAGELTAIENRIAQGVPQLTGQGVTVVPLQRLVAENLESSLLVLLGDRLVGVEIH